MGYNMRKMSGTERDEIIRRLNNVLIGIRVNPDKYDNDSLYLANKVYEDLHLKADSYIKKLKKTIGLLEDKRKTFSVKIFFRNGEVEKFKAYIFDYEKHDILNSCSNTFNFIDTNGEIITYSEFFLKKVMVDNDCMYDEDEEREN